MTESTKTVNPNHRKGPSIKKLKSMNYIEILEHYTSYPDDNLKFTCNAHIDSQSKKDYRMVQFLSEQDKAEGWIQKFPNIKRYSKFLQTNLHYLPEHLWSRLQEVAVDGVLVGYKVRDNCVNFFVYSADIDETTIQLYKEISKQCVEKELVRYLLSKFEEKGLESWLTIRAAKLV